jgi:hypothetical protein
VLLLCERANVSAPLRREWYELEPAVDTFIPAAQKNN